MRIGIFGGSFDPPHAGHRRAAQAFADFAKPDILLVIPAATAPLKSAAHFYAPRTRLALCRALFRDLSCVLVTDLEIVRPGASYTIDTLEELRKLYPQGDFYLLIGADQIGKFCAWHRWEEILRLATVVVVPRNATAPQLPDTLINNPLYAEKIRVFSAFEPLDISSTQIRAALRIPTKTKETP
jgi:nicotinate-nucleotide adenylyltransferase